MSGLVLGIETSCDETAAAVVADGRQIRSSIVASQIDLHARFGGVVPELAGRAHLESIVTVVNAALSEAGLDLERGRRELSAVAVTVGPGLIGSLLVGVSFAKSLAIALDLAFVGVNHLEGHLYGALLENGELELPAVVLLVSGGHTLLVEIREPGRYKILGRTVDDAAGEAFDKVARFLGLGYPGGPAIERAAASGDRRAIDLPRPMLGDGLNFSFSGLKTAVVQQVAANPGSLSDDVAASFQAAVIEVLVAKALLASELVGARSLCLAGGVAANGPLRRLAQSRGQSAGLQVYLPSPVMCTDNAAMIAAAGFYRLQHDGPSPLSLGAIANLALAAD